MSFLLFILASVVIELGPGPNMAYLALLSLTEGRRAGFLTVAGIAAGLLTVGMGSALGIAALIEHSPLAYQVLRWGGVLYLLWLAWNAWNTAKETSPSQTNAYRRDRFFWRGFITNILNPKAYLFYIAILPGFIHPGADAGVQTFILTFIYVVIATLIHSGIVIIYGFANRFLSDPRRITIARWIFSFMLIGVALWFAITTGKIFE